MPAEGRQRVWIMMNPIWQVREKDGETEINRKGRGEANIWLEADWFWCRDTDLPTRLCLHKSYHIRSDLQVIRNVRLCSRKKVRASKVSRKKGKAEYNVCGVCESVNGAGDRPQRAIAHVTWIICCLSTNCTSIMEYHWTKFDDLSKFVGRENECEHVPWEKFVWMEEGKENCCSVSGETFCVDEA